MTELRAFEAAARHLSFRAAAAELGVTPTAISHQIKLLEHYCGRLLFRRRPRPLELTVEGRQLFPIVRDGLEGFADTLMAIRTGTAGGQLRITATNAFAARWLVPRLPNWRAAFPHIKLDIRGTDAVLDLAASEADIAVRYARDPPSDGQWVELSRDTFLVVASPKLVGNTRKCLRPAELTRFPLIDIYWPSTDVEAPSWRRWQAMALRRYKNVPDLAALPSLAFREELHAIEAVISGQGIAICSDLLIAPELANGALVQVSDLTLSGLGFYIVHRVGHPRLAQIEAFSLWAHAMRSSR